MSATFLHGDCRQVLQTLPDKHFYCCVTSPPYFGLRSYGGGEAEIGQEPTPSEYVAALCAVFDEVWRVLRDDGTLWLNLGDSYAGSWGNYAPTGKGGQRAKQTERFDRGAYRDKSDWRPPTSNKLPGLKPKDLIGIPWRVAFALQERGWYLRSDIIWSKPNPMPESVTDRPTRSHEYIFLLSKSASYYYDAAAVAEPCGPFKPCGPNSRADNDRDPAHGTRKQDALGKQTYTGFNDRWRDRPTETRNKRSVWEVAPKPFKDSHFAVFPPELITPCVLAGCPPAGKRCDCGEVIETPIGSGEVVDPTLFTGRKGFNRERRDAEGTRPITRGEQRQYAEQVRRSEYRDEMESECGPAFAHYIRTDRSGARPLPPILLNVWLGRGWLTPALPCTCPVEGPGAVLDPFGGSFTTAAVSAEYGRDCTCIELNAAYHEIGKRRMARVQRRMTFEEAA